MKLFLAATPTIRQAGRGAPPIIAMLLLVGSLALQAGPARARASANTSGQGKNPPTSPPKGLVKLAEPWPDAEGMRKRRTDAENRPLFQSTDPLTFTLTADFKAVNKDRDENSTKRYAATLVVAGDRGKTDTIPVNLGTRGHFRLRATSCAFVPLRVEFPKNEATGTAFDGQRALKLVTHCRDNKDYEQYTLREYLVYGIYNLLTPRSFRARLAKVAYVDSVTGKPLTTRYAMLLEDDDDVARRVDTRIAELLHVQFKEVESEAVTLMALFEYMIGSTDYSIYLLHNVRLLQDQARVLYTVPYDFDLTGLVNTRYAVVDKRLGISTVRERLYRGPCRSEAELEPILGKFRAKKAEVMAVYDSLPDLESSYRREAKEYLEEFYSMISRKDRVKKVLVDECHRAPAV